MAPIGKQSRTELISCNLIEKYEISIETRGGNDTRIKFFISTKKFINKTLSPTRGSPGALLVPSGTLREAESLVIRLSENLCAFAAKRNNRKVRQDRNAKTQLLLVYLKSNIVLSKNLYNSDVK